MLRRMFCIVFLLLPNMRAAQTDPPLTLREQKMQERIDALERRLAALEAHLAAQPAAALGTTTASATASVATPASAAADALASPPPVSAEPQPSAAARLPNGTTFNVMLDGYYEYNFNRPAGRINLLRAYDVLSNSFSLNQATMVIERAPDLNAGRRFGVRLDLQYGQATETLQGSALNEPRPQVYRPVFQAYGTYIVPVGSGLTVDFGKWASALGVENNYTKDQINYSRSYLFNFLPFYHFGFRSSYNVSPWLNVSYWLINGTQQSEDFNDNKSQALLLTLKPSKSVTWNVNYYTGIENRDTQPNLNPGLPALPTQPGLTNTLALQPNRRLNIFDTYATWNVNSRLTLAGEGDYVTYHAELFTPHVSAAAAYARYQFTPKFALGGRGEYFSDRGGLFSGVTQALKETTLTADYLLADGFLMRTEWRRDFSNRPFFLTDIPDILRHEQTTATLGLIWWFGNKSGGW